MASFGSNITRSNSGKTGILDRPLLRPKAEVSLSAFSFLFSEIIQYFQNRANSVTDLEKKLEELGYGIGMRMIELISVRERVTKREIRLLNILQYLSSTVWKHLFNKVADNLERSTENADEYMIHEHDPITNMFVSVPADMSQFNAASFLAGIIRGILDSAMFKCVVTAHTINVEEDTNPENPVVATDKTIFLIKFAPEVMEREKKFG